MKKLFKKVAGFAALALAALVPSMSANAATIYLDASAAGWTSANLHYWGNVAGDKPGDQVAGKSNFFIFTDVPDIQNGSFLFQTKPGEWGNDNASKDASDREVNVTFTDKHLYKLTSQAGRWKFVDQGTYTPVSTTYQWYLKSAAWSDWNDKKNFTLQSDGTYLLENVDITAESEFKAFMTTNNENEKGYRYGNDNSHYSFDAPKDEMLYEKGFNMKMKTAGKYSFTIYQDGSNWKMKTVKAGNAPEHVYVIGSIKDNKWNTKSTPAMTKNGSKFTLSNVELVNDGDKAKFTLITKLDSDWNVVNGSNRFGPSSESDTDASTTAANMVKEYKVGTDDVGSAKNWLIAAGTYDLVFDYDALTLTITESGVTPSTTYQWYLKSAAWNNWNDKKNFTLQSDGTYLLENVDITAESEFKAFMTTNNENEKGYRYGNDNSHYSFDAPKDEMLYEKGFNMKMKTAGKYSFTIYQDGSNWKMKTVKAGNAPEHVYVIGSIKDNKWNTKSTPAMTKNGSKFTLSNVELVNDGDKAKFTLITKLDSDWNVVNGSNRFGPSSESDTDASTTAANMVKEYKVGTDDVGSAKNWLIAAGTYDLVFDYDALTLTITESGDTPPEPVQPDNQYYLLGDVNNWMNDGTYTTNGKEYGYGYSKAENGVRADYKFKQTSISGDDSWYVLDMSKTKTGGKLWGQFTIVQDKGVFQPAKLEENRNDGRDVINWNGNWEQWSNAYDRTDKNNYLKETVKAYIDVPSDPAASAGVAAKIRRSNFHLDHNLYKGVKIYFNPTTSKIFMTYSDYQDFYIYLSTDADRKENGDRKVNVIKESMNNDNYTLDFSSLRVVKSDGTPELDTDNKMEHVVISDGSEGDQLPNGLKFTNYWKIKIPNGLEGPSGQKFMVSLYNAKDENAQKMTSIFLNNLYFIDGVRVFATPSADVEVAAVSYRIYGLPADGDPENLQIFAADGTQRAVKDDPNDEFGWVALQWGKFGYHPTSTTWWAGSVPEEYSGIVEQKTGFYPTKKDDTKFHEVPASHASECIQWKITYGRRPSAANGMKKTRTGVQLNPATADLTVDRSDLNADWVLNGRHKELVIGVATGVEDIEMEDGEISEEGEAVAPVYYNLQGVRVAEPQHGLYIKVTGNKSEKILVK